MDDLTLSGVVLGLLIVLMLLRVPVAVALGGLSFVGLWVMLGPGTAWGILTAVPYDFISHWTLSSVPMFLLMGYICYHSQLTDGLFRVARAWLRGHDYLRAAPRHGTVLLDHRVEMRKNLTSPEQWKDWYLTQLRGIVRRRHLGDLLLAADDELEPVLPDRLEMGASCDEGNNDASPLHQHTDVSANGTSPKDADLHDVLPGSFYSSGIPLACHTPECNAPETTAAILHKRRQP